MIHLIGYVALVINLTSMAMKDVFHLRILSLVANALYVVYGILLHAPPLIIGCTIAVLLHGYYVVKLWSKSDNKIA